MIAKNFKLENEQLDRLLDQLVEEIKRLQKENKDLREFIIERTTT